MLEVAQPVNKGTAEKAYEKPMTAWDRERTLVPGRVEMGTIDTPRTSRSKRPTPLIEQTRETSKPTWLTIVRSHRRA